MKYTKYTIKTTTKDADMVSALLMDYDINDVQIENNVQLTDDELNQMYADFKKELPEDDGSCDLSFFIEALENGKLPDGTEEKIEAVKNYLKEATEIYGIDPVRFETEELESEDWENSWKEYFQPFAVDDILIAPTWFELTPDTEIHRTAPGYINPENAARDSSEGSEVLDFSKINPELIIRIDPGMAFGTGTHETTRLCLRSLRKYLIEGDIVLDLGCGSGILGIGAMKMKAGAAVSVDIDEQAVVVAEENYAINGIERGKLFFHVGDVVNNEELKKTVIREGFDKKALKKLPEDSYGPYDITVINILAEVICLMMPSVHQYLRKDGTLILSGILDSREQMIKDAIRQNGYLEYIETIPDGEWVSITAKRK